MGNGLNKWIENRKKTNMANKKAIIKSDWDGKGKWTQDIWIDNHHVIVDEPTSVGGLDLAPTPMDYLKVAIASCTSMTIKYFCDREKWALDDISVTCDIVDGEIEIDILTYGDLTADQKEVLIKIAEKCPVKKVLMSDLKAKTRIV